jgi:hypothetical protein
MRTPLHGILPALIFTLALFALPPESRAGNVGDDTNAALIPANSPTPWASSIIASSMNQVMGGLSYILPGSGTGPIRGPAGVYALVMLDSTLLDITSNMDNEDTALENYFSYFLQDPAVSGLLLIIKWSDLSPNDPGDDFNNPAPDSLRFDYIGAAIKAIDAWNSQPHFLQQPRTLQLSITPGFHSPDWLFQEMDSSGAGSCDGLFVAAGKPPMTVRPATTLSGCGYTKIFYDTEDYLADPTKAIQKNLPLPWNNIYKTKWRNFLTFLNDYIGSRSEFVSISVAGPTASSGEISLPNGEGNNKNVGLQALQLPGMSTGISVYTAWNCLLGNNYGVIGNCITDPTSYGTTSNYVNTDRAFIEEWAAAMDMFGQIFSGVTLVVTTGLGLPNFCALSAAGGASGSPPCPASDPFLTPPPAFAPDCGTGTTATMDCAAETAILAYFAGPPIGGNNAKATSMAGLTATASGPLSSLSVKWLSEKTSTGFSVLPNSGALVSRMLGGAQFAKPFHNSTSPSPEDELLDVLKAFFTGTSVASSFGASGTGMNGTEPVHNATINYLQVWNTDLVYAFGLSGCPLAQFFKQPANGGPPPGCKRASMHKIPFMGMSVDADYLLEYANYSMLLYTAELAALPAPCGCSGDSVQRGAFPGDPVCVTKMQQNQVTTDNTNANGSSTGTYSSDYTIPPPKPIRGPSLVPPVYYGVCKMSRSPLYSQVYRQAYMGDYVCVTSGNGTIPGEAQQVASDNASYPSNVVFAPSSACQP